MGGDILELRREVQAFIDQRDWEKYHTPKSTAMGVAIEAGELMEVFQWHDNLGADEYDSDIRDEVADGLADILIYSLSLADQFDIDVEAAVNDKIDRNEQRFDLESIDEINESLDQWIDE